MDCIKNNKQGVEILTDYGAGTLDPGIAAELNTHTRQCPECRALLDAQCAVWEMLNAWTPVEVSQDFDAKLYARIAGEQSIPAWRRWLSRILQPATPYTWWKPAVSVAVAGAVLSLGLVVRLPQDQIQPVQHKSTTVQSAASSEEIDLQQVQQALDDMDILAPNGQTGS
jgi:anti-sigma factor RsiW